MENLADCQLSLAIEDVHIVHIEDHLDFVVNLVPGTRVNVCDKDLFAGLQIDEDFVAHQLGDIHNRIDLLGE